MSDDLDEISGGLGRMLSTARLAGRLGRKTAGRVLFGPRSEAAGDAAADADRSDTAVAAARRLVAQMSQLKGLVMKAGQIASYMPGSMPPAAQRVLAELQASSTPMAFHRIDEMLAAELGASGRALFESIDERPFAAASIGQIHRAVHAGAAVAVKVQYPGVEDAIRSDLRWPARSRGWRWPASCATGCSRSATVTARPTTSGCSRGCWRRGAASRRPAPAAPASSTG